MNQNTEGTIVLLLLGLLAYYLVSTGSFLGDGNGHISMDKLGNEIQRYTVDEWTKD